jgi:plastocyanin
MTGASSDHPSDSVLEARERVRRGAALSLQSRSARCHGTDWGEGSRSQQAAGRRHPSVRNRSEVVQTKLTIAPAVALGLVFTGLAVAGQPEAKASSIRPTAADPAVTIKDFMYAPAEIAAKAGQAITITNNDGFNHTVTAKDGTFNLDVPPNGSVTLMVPKAGSFPYSCTYHPGQHNPASINVS